MTQSEEAFDTMRCERCGQFSGPECLCVLCHQVEIDSYPNSFTCERCGGYLHGGIGTETGWRHEWCADASETDEFDAVPE